MIGGLHHASLTTTDADRLSRFYERHFGFHRVLETEWDGGNPLADAIYGIADTSVRMIMLKRETSFLEIFEFRRPAATRISDRQVSTAGFTHVALTTDNIEADYKRLSDAGVPFNCPPQDVPGLCIATYARDPDGNLVELLQPYAGGPFAP